MTKRQREKYKAFAEALMEVAHKLFNHYSVQHVAAFHVHLDATIPKCGRRCLKKRHIIDFLEHGLCPEYPSAPYEKRGEQEDTYRGVIRREAEGLVMKALKDVILALYSGMKNKEFLALIDKNMERVCMAYGRYKALAEPHGHLHSMLIDFQRQFRGKYSGFDSLAKYNPDDVEYSFPD